MKKSEIRNQAACDLLNKIIWKIPIRLIIFETTKDDMFRYIATEASDLPNNKAFDIIWNDKENQFEPRRKGKNNEI